ncbi:hypothetical protein B0H65DRAFT_553929 [Neurospora tetraspora]|uniref:Coenzyme Q-binding protein COQ10 START domain-containing protein n=1 Tax=Neurospora tetraspora TaxID=94610 RepID=A0AAE0JM76_9PEZI|nr:hypothetical protein B0H65DRAFT_553929 [Neurospora tetraspora]
MTSPSPPIPPDTAATGCLGPFPTPTHGQPGAGSFTIACSTHIKAAPRTCLEVLLKASEYPSWNRYCRKCIIDAQPDGDHQALPNLVGPEFLRLGTKFTFHVHMDPLSEDSSARNTALEVSRLERIDEVLQIRRTGFRIAWKTRPTLFMPNRMLRCERVQEFVQVYPPSGTLDEPETAYRCWETFYGVLAPVVKAAAGNQIMRGGTYLSSSEIPLSLGDISYLSII